MYWPNIFDYQAVLFLPGTVGLFITQMQLSFALDYFWLVF